MPILALTIAVGAISGCEAVEDDADAAPKSSVSTTTKEEGSEAPLGEEEAKPAAEEKADLSTSQKNAVRSAENYIGIMAFSPSGLTKQLEFEGYTAEEAAYAVDSLDVNWDEQAVKAAENYLLVSPFSREGLITQLEFEGYRSEERRVGKECPV